MGSYSQKSGLTVQGIGSDPPNKGNVPPGHKRLDEQALIARSPGAMVSQRAPKIAQSNTRSKGHTHEGNRG